MIWILVAIMMILWLLGIITSYTLGGMIHILLVIAVILLLVSVLRGNRSA